METNPTTTVESTTTLENDNVLPQWVIDMIEGTQPDFWWVY